MQARDYRHYGQIERKYQDPFAAPTLFQYAGLQWDEDAGLYLSYTRAYDARIGRWLNRDPIGGVGGVNVYGYVNANPINSIDPFGLCGACLLVRPPVVPEPLLETIRPLENLQRPTDPLVKHHSDPEFLGGPKNQPTTPLPESEHIQLHMDLSDFLRQETDEFGNHMRPQRNNPGRDIRDNFPRDQRLDALRRFYEKFRDKYPEPARDFFKQDPDLQCR